MSLPSLHIPSELSPINSLIFEYLPDQDLADWKSDHPKILDLCDNLIQKRAYQAFTQMKQPSFYKGHFEWRLQKNPEASKNFIPFFTMIVQASATEELKEIVKSTMCVANMKLYQRATLSLRPPFSDLDQGEMILKIYEPPLGNLTKRDFYILLLQSYSDRQMDPEFTNPVLNVLKELFTTALLNGDLETMNILKKGNISIFSPSLSGVLRERDENIPLDSPLRKSRATLLDFLKEIDSSMPLDRRVSDSMEEFFMEAILAQDEEILKVMYSKLSEKLTDLESLILYAAEEGKPLSVRALLEILNQQEQPINMRIELFLEKAIAIAVKKNHWDCALNILKFSDTRKIDLDIKNQTLRFIFIAEPNDKICEILKILEKDHQV